MCIENFFQGAANCEGKYQLNKTEFCPWVFAEYHEEQLDQDSLVLNV